MTHESRISLAVRTLASHAGNRGSIPLCGTKLIRYSDCGKRAMVTDSSTETDGSRIRPLYLCARIALIAFKSGNITEVCHGKQKAVLTVVIIAVIAIVAAGIVIGIVLSFQKKPDKKPSMPTETDDGIYTVINAEDDGGSEEVWEEFSVSRQM